MASSAARASPLCSLDGPAVTRIQDASLHRTGPPVDDGPGSFGRPAPGAGGAGGRSGLGVRLARRRR